MNNIKYAVGYCRVSTEQQVDQGHSLQAQQNAIYAYCGQRQLFLREMYIEKGISGKKIANRPELNKLLSTLKYGDYVIFYSLSRMARNTREALDILNIIKEKNCFLAVVDKQIDTNNAGGKLLFDMMNAVNEFEVTQLGERVSHVLNDMSANGKLKTKPKYGMKSPGKGKPFVENEEEQLVIKYMKSLVDVCPNITCSQISKKLTEEGYKPPGKKWYPNQIKIILSQNNIR